MMICHEKEPHYSNCLRSTNIKNMMAVKNKNL